MKKTNRLTLSLFIVLGILILAVGVVLAENAFAFEPFTGNQELLLNFANPGAVPQVVSSSVLDAGVIGGERDLILSIYEGNNGYQASAGINVGGNPLFEYSTPSNMGGTAEIQWDGVDGSPTLNPIGLRNGGAVGLDLTNGGLKDRFIIAVQGDDLAAPLTLTVYTDATHFSTLQLDLPGGIDRYTQQSFPMLFGNFAQGAGAAGPADFTNVGATTLLVDGRGSAMSLDLTLFLVNTDDGVTHDFGDLADDEGLSANYGTLLSMDGARHLAGTLVLGTQIDTELDGQPTPFANGDDASGTFDDEDGVMPIGLWSAGTVAAGKGGKINVTVSGCVGTCYLTGYIDWNKNKSWDLTRERAFMDVPVVNGTQTVSFNIPTTGGAIVFPNQTYAARFRLVRATSAGTMLPTGEQFSGEVEDYLWTFGPTAVDLSDVNAVSTNESGFLFPVAGVLALGGLGWLALRRRK
jgi:LPXTG-motif cell wall-anchored protein